MRNLKHFNNKVRNKDKRKFMCYFIIIIQIFILIISNLFIRLHYYGNHIQTVKDYPTREKVTPLRLHSTPANLSIIINSGEEYTYNSLVSLSLNASGAFFMRFKNENESWSDWETYTISKQWILSEGYGLKTVSVSFKDNYNNISVPINDTIIKKSAETTPSLLENPFFIITMIAIGSAVVVAIPTSVYVYTRKKEQKKEGLLPEEKAAAKKKRLMKLMWREKEEKPIKEKPLILTPIPLPEDVDTLKIEEKKLQRLKSEIKSGKISYICALHKGKIVGSVYICPNCHSIYCDRCAKILKIKGRPCSECRQEISIKISNKERINILRSNSNQIIKDLLEKDPLIKDIIERERNFDEVPEINEYEFTLLSTDELNKLDLIDLSLEEKIQFIKEILSLSKEERKKLIDEMLENKD